VLAGHVGSESLHGGVGTGRGGRGSGDVLVDRIVSGGGATGRELVLGEEGLLLLRLASSEDQTLERTEETVHNETEHNDTETSNVKGGKRLAVGHKVEREGNVGKRNHDGHSEPEDVGGSVLEDKNNENVVVQVEGNVRTDVDGRHLTVIDVGGRALLVEDRVLAGQATSTIPEVLGEVVDGNLRGKGTGDEEGERSDELVDSDPSVKVDGVEVDISEGLLFVHTRQTHRDTRENEHKDPHGDVGVRRVVGVALGALATGERRPEDSDDTSDDDTGGNELVELVAGSEEETGNDHRHGDGSLLDKDDEGAVVVEVTGSETLHDTGDGIEETHDGKVPLGDGELLRGDGGTKLDHGEDVRKRTRHVDKSGQQVDEKRVVGHRGVKKDTEDLVTKTDHNHEKEGNQQSLALTSGFLSGHILGGDVVATLHIQLLDGAARRLKIIVHDHLRVTIGCIIGEQALEELLVTVLLPTAHFT